MPFRLIILLLTAHLGAADCTLISYNVWFDDVTGAEQRYPAILGYLGRSSADLICLQEVTPTFAIAVEAFAKASGYQVLFDQRLPGYGNAVLSKGAITQSEIIALPTRLGRQALRCRTVIGGRSVTVVDCHLDSMPEDTQRRIQQVQVIDRGMSGDCLWLGDFNFGSDEPEQAALTRWTDFGAGDAKPTYDPIANALAGRNSFADEPPRRLDRVLALGSWTLKRYHVDTEVGFSDHYPLVVTVE